MHKTIKTAVFSVLFVSALSGQAAYAQLDQTFNDVFNYFLRERLDFPLQQFHGQHYFPAADRAERVLTPALNGLIASNISSYPLSSTIAGLSLDISSGRPVLTSESLGPIFAETAETIGAGKLNIGLIFSYMNLDRFRGLDVNDMLFTFIHQDVTPTPPFGEDEQGSLGDPAYELDAINVYPNLDINSSIFVFSLAAGITRNLDISLAVPIVNVNLSGNATAVISSYSYGRLNPARPEFQGAAHRFGGDPLNPILEADTTYSVITNGIGDLAVRLKYVLRSQGRLNLATMADVRIPTGDERNFLSTGKTNVRFLWIMSSQFGDFNPHLNIGYDLRGGNFDSNEIEYAVGFDQKLSNAFTFAIDLLGTYDLQEGEAIELFPGSVPIREDFEGGSLVRVLDLSNIPESLRDNTLDLAVGFRLAPSDRVVLMGNLLTPIDHGGLRSTITPTFGLSISI